MRLQFPEARPHFAIPKGYGFHRLTLPELQEMVSLLGTLQIWQYPRRGHRYAVGVDVADGLGQDRSVVDVFRLGTLTEVEEQVAQYISDQITPRQLAYVVDAVGRLYRWPDDRPAIVAVENNNHGLSTQDILQLHLGYDHFYIWEVLDQADPAKRFTTKLGWVTTSRTRPILLSHFHDAVVAIDPLTGFSDCRINSTHTFEEMRDFQTEGALWEAEAARGAHDDCILAGAIAHMVCWRLSGGEVEPLADRRRRRHEEEIRRLRVGTGERRDFRNTDTLAEEATYVGVSTPEEEDEDGGYYDPDGRAFGGTLY